MRRLKEPIRVLGDLVFPRGCALCGRSLATEEPHWCAGCASEVMETVAGDYCPRCALPVGPFMVSTSGCAACREKRSTLDGMARVGPYGGPIGRLVRRFKFGKEQRLDAVLGELLASAVERWDWSDELDAIVPVPCAWSSRLRYGGSPVSLLARQLATRLDIRIRRVLRLRLRGKKRRQTGLPLAERVINVRGIFRAVRLKWIEGATLCLVDDVSTSGATLQEAARTLRRAGAAKVYAGVLAKTDPAHWAEV